MTVHAQSLRIRRTVTRPRKLVLRSKDKLGLVSMRGILAKLAGGTRGDGPHLPLLAPIAEGTEPGFHFPPALAR